MLSSRSSSIAEIFMIIFKVFFFLCPALACIYSYHSLYLKHIFSEEGSIVCKRNFAEQLFCLQQEMKVRSRNYSKIISYRISDYFTIRCWIYLNGHMQYMNNQIPQNSRVYVIKNKIHDCVKNKKPHKIWCISMCKICTNKREKNTDSHCKTNHLHPKETKSHPKHQSSWNSRFIVVRVLKNLPHANVKIN